MLAFDILDETLVQQLKERLCRGEGELTRLDEQLEQLKANRDRLSGQVQIIRSLLGSVRSPVLAGTDTEQQSALGPDEQPLSVSKGRQATADDVYELLRSRGEMHYEKIFEAILKQGLEVGGQGKPNNLLSRFFNDPRLERVKRGTYSVKSQVEDELGQEQSDSTLSDLPFE